MNFLNSPALWGGLAAAGVAVPIIIHLLHQRHRRRTDWAAMELLRRALVIRSGQVRLEDLLLLFLRCLVIALVAFALLRPILDDKTAQYMQGEQTVGMVIAIDVSYSMGHGKQEKRLDAAKARVREILSTARDSDQVKIVLLGNEPRDLIESRYGNTDFSSELDAIEPFPERLNLERGLQKISESVEKLQGAASVIECYLVTDAQEIDWSKLSGEAKSSLDEISEKANFFITPVGVDGTENLAITKFGYASGSLGLGGTARFTAEVKNLGGETSEGKMMTFYVNGNPVQNQQIGTIGGGETKAISFFSSLDGLNSANLSVKLSQDSDSLSQDNERHTVIEAREKTQILCVDGEPERDKNLSEILWLVKALELIQDEENGAIEAIETNSQNLEAETFSDFDVIVLANVDRIGSTIAGRLNDFVNDGGGLVLFAGENVTDNAESYNEDLHGEEVNLLPGEIVEKSEDSWTLGSIQSNHVLASLAESIPEAGRSNLTFRAAMEIKPDLDTTTILSLSESNLPLLLEKKVGAGSVLMFTTTADDEWSDLPLHPLFPMLMQQAVTHLTSRPGHSNAMVGDLVQLPLAGQQAGSTVTLRTPDPDNNESMTVKLTVLDSGEVVCPIEASSSGFFSVETKDSPPVSIAVNVDPGESDAREVKADDWEQILGASQAKVIPRGSNNLASIVEESRKGMEISRTLLILALVIFILQGFLAKLFTKRMTDSGDSTLEQKLRKYTVAAARRS